MSPSPVRVFDSVLVLWGAIAAVLLAWQAAALARGITFGPGGPVLAAPCTSASATLAIVLSTVPVVARLAWRLRGSRGRINHAFILQASLGLFALALSYRLGACVFWALAIGCRLVAPAGWRAATWWVAGLALAASVAPIDVALRSGRSRGPRLVVTVNCEAATGEMVQAVYDGNLVCVANGPVLYYPPSRVVVW